MKDLQKSLAMLAISEVFTEDCESPTRTSEGMIKNTSSGDTSVSSNTVEDIALSNHSRAVPTDTDVGSDTLDKEESSYIKTVFNKVSAFYWAYDFPINILIIICIARAYPKFGAVTVMPKISAGWVATGIIFVISGLGLKTAELFKVMFKHVAFNAFVEIFNFGVVSSIVFGVSRALAASGAIPQALADGFAIAACLPMSINAVIILTQSAHGDEAAAIFHTAVGNIAGIFLSPFLIVKYLPSVTADVELLQVFKELTYKVIFPLIAGQILHLACKPLREFYFAHKKRFKKIQEYSLVFIV
jgi:solute carrier family 10 (sodium/bile acid cotransporter), member 7